MTKPPHQPTDHARTETIRQHILRLLSDTEYSIGELSKSIQQSEKIVLEHLQELQKTGKIQIIPAECLDCGFVFEERNRVKKPGKCPKCKSLRIAEPLYQL
jgi:predicted Zn-ribbon and HTH transcriptional regulator